MGRSEALALFAATCVACTLTGLGNYDVETCPTTLGKIVAGKTDNPTSVEEQFLTSVNGSGPIAAYLSGGCLSVATQNLQDRSPVTLNITGSDGSPCAIPTADLPHQPAVAAINSTSYALASIVTTPVDAGSCPLGALAISTITGTQANAPTVSACDQVNGAALPAIALIPNTGAALVAWYSTPYKDSNGSLLDPVGDCNTGGRLPEAGAGSAHLIIGRVDNASTQNPSPPVQTVMMNTQVIAIAPPAITKYGAEELVLASPDTGAVSTWTLDGSGSATPGPTASSLAGARAVAVATDPSQNIALAAVIGCKPQQSIALSLGTMSGFGRAITVAAATSDFALQPSVAWVPPNDPQPGYWLVSWISGSGGHRVLARRFGATGQPVGGVLDPGVPATAATAVADPANGGGFLFLLSQPPGGAPAFETIQLGCAP